MPCIEITDADFDDMHHALGRPTLLDLRLGKHYRNFYATEADSAWARRAETLGMWDRITRTPRPGKMVTYRVNADGKSALADWLKLVEHATRAPTPVDPRDDDPTREGIFRSHNCWRCQSGAKPCVRGAPNRCEFPRARND